jgi:hypothetical protein
MAEATIPVPLWLLWARAILGALSLAGFAVHYNLRVRHRRTIERTIKRSIVRLFVTLARANRLERLSTAGTIIERGMRFIYGNRIRRIVAIGSSMSVLYIGLAFWISGGSAFNWSEARSRKSQLEIAADPILHNTPPEDISWATEKQPCPPPGTAGPCGDYVNNTGEAKHLFV